MSKARLELGRKGEELAAEYLQRKGFRIIKQNYRCFFGEIDIVAVDKEYLVFVEVRTKSSAKFGTHAESITSRKIQKIRRVAECFLTCFPEQVNRKMRFDFVGVNLKSDKPQIEHYAGVF
ncbi:hypothetical protein Tfer_1670 [Thermincola ferriacetica]|uniref:UPF0102 protein TherJR_2027 n=2 Tax=Thermincola TaxID=278993 RepID=D5X8J6_THEPJ|nr:MULTISPECIES: YraN family protein [Thermincola]ADG82872.1 protein of unknown function UPF0102 [Thermincola potens JR]KNZ69649.1 hypothetical protein Tfer_1670 [Thermincola ferriacetica]